MRSGIHTRIPSFASWLPGLISLAAFCTYILRFLNIAKYLNINMDEGTYLVKGLLFTSGQYTPYQFYGPWTQKMPLAYFLFGWAQAILGPGLGSGRYLSLFFAIFLIMGVWVLISRLGGKWAAALALIYLALNLAGIMKLAYATTQAQVACFGVWMLAFSVGCKPKTWQVIAGALMAGLMVITRQNMLPFAVLWIGYMFWTQERKQAWIALAVTASVLIVTHILFWPNILSVWALLPQSLTPFLDPWRLKEDVTYFNQWIPSFATQFDAFWEGVRYYFVPFFGVIFSIALAPAYHHWPDKREFKTYLFLVSSWFTLLLTHFMASFFMNYGFYTFSGYIAFFDYVAIAIMALSFRYWRLASGFLGKLLTSATVIFIPTLFVYLGSSQLAFLVTWLETPLPRFRFFQILPGSTNLAAILTFKLGIPQDMLAWLLPTCVGFLISLLIFPLASLGKKFANTNWVTTAACIFLGLGFVLTPFLGRVHPDLVCAFDVIQSNADVGQQAATVVPPGASVYWYPGYAPTPFLYMEKPKLFPPQLDNSFSFVKGGDPDLVARYGFWNVALADQWVKSSDYMLLVDFDNDRGRNLDEMYNRYGSKFEFKRLLISRQPMSCSNRENWFLFVFSIRPK